MMDYSLNVQQFESSQMFDSNHKFYHKSGYRFRLFPFVTNQQAETVRELDSVVGAYLSSIQGIQVKSLNVEDLIVSLQNETEIQTGREELFKEMIRQVFFFPDGRVRPLNLELLEQTQCSNSSEQRIVDYLVDVLGEKKVLENVIKKAKSTTLRHYNVLEKMVLSHLQYNTVNSDDQSIPYFKLSNTLDECFESDFRFILDYSERSKEYLTSLLEFYYFAYTTQAVMQLSRFLEGDRNKNYPLYFCLEWEKTSQGRLCFSEGWQKLQTATDKVFAHAMVLEMLNQTAPGSEVVDYISLAEMTKDEAHDIDVSSKIDLITKRYRESITDCVEMNELKKKDSSHSRTAASIRFLFDSVLTQFVHTNRNKPFKQYADRFELYCHKFLKNRGRSGYMLNITEETLIFLTRLCIKKEEKKRLKDVFGELEKRGVFFDEISKDQVADYYEKLNLIEKKSDSGDAKYVKRIL